MKILTIPGSLRVKSFNKALARYIVSLPYENVEFKYFELNDIPMFNADLEQDLPDPILKLIEEIKTSDAFIISTPEYNNSVPAPVKNLLHWLSRSYSKKYIKDKPLAITGVTDGGFGTVRAQNELLLTATIIGMRPNAKHRLPISKALEIFDDEGNILSEEVKLKINDFVTEFVKDIRTS